MVKGLNLIIMYMGNHPVTIERVLSRRKKGGGRLQVGESLRSREREESNLINIKREFQER